jgi:hypothetical protein
MRRTSSSPAGSHRGRSGSFAISITTWNTIRAMRAALSVSMVSTSSEGW